jgi:hypothetical protein
MAKSTTTAVRVNRTERTCRLDTFDGHRVLSIRQLTGRRGEETRYHLSEVPCDFGRGFELSKASCDGPETYHVHLDATGDACTCLGNLRWGHKTVCKHVAAVKALIAAKRL